MPRPRRWICPGVLCALVAAGATSAALAQGSRALATFCRTGALAGTFTVVPGSAGAGHIEYTLRVRNRSSATCTVAGTPELRLLDRHNRVLPSNSFSEQSGTAVRVDLRPGGYAAAVARFSPTVPGPGEPTTRQCEPTAYRVRAVVPPGDAVVVAPISPPTPVCVRGRMRVSVFVPGRSVPRP